MIAENQILQICITVQLLIIIVSYGVKPCFVFRAKHRHTIPSEIRACHGDNVSVCMVHYTAYDVAQSGVCIGTGVVKLINGKQTVVEGVIRQLTGGITQRGMSAKQYLCF